MIFLITGASHTGKTLLAQELLETYKYPYLSIDLLKMGLIRSGQTALTVFDDEELTQYLWPIVCEMIKTSIENKQHLIVEGCYIPFSWRKDFSSEHLAFINDVALIFSENYIKTNYDTIMQHAGVIEYRMDDDYSKEQMITDNRLTLEKCKKHNSRFMLIDETYDFKIDMDFVFESERLLYKRMNRNDFVEVAKMLQDPEVMYAWEHNFTDEDVYAWIDKRNALYRLFGYDYFLAIDKLSGEVIGQIGLLDEPIDDKHFTGIGYILKKEFWHKGYATEGAGAMLDYAFSALRMSEVIATIRPENKASCKVAERLGMSIQREFIKVRDDKKMPHVVYSIQRENG